MNPQEEPLVQNEQRIPIRQVDPRAFSAELRLRLEEVRQAVSRLEEAKIVSQETMQLEVSV